MKITGTKLISKKQIEQTALQKDKWLLLLFVTGKTAKTTKAVNNLKIICENQLKDNYKIEIVDILKNPNLARENQILAVPTLIRKFPLPQKNIIGDLSDIESVLVGLDIIGKT